MSEKGQTETSRVFNAQFLWYLAQFARHYGPCIAIEGLGGGGCSSPGEGGADQQMDV